MKLYGAVERNVQRLLQELRNDGTNMIMTVEQIAQVCHDANASYCRTLGDDTQVDWDFAPKWQKESVINGVKFRMNNPTADPRDSHENWLKAKRADGWKWGSVKNPSRKEHPCMVDYDKLPTEQRAKDCLFSAICAALIPFTQKAFSS
jgi:hypothetical protein